MQGWRLSMEDADIASLNIDSKNSIFGVFDGHGGSEVALFVKSVLVDELKKNTNYKQGNYGAAL